MAPMSAVIDLDALRAAVQANTERLEAMAAEGEERRASGQAQSEKAISKWSEALTKMVDKKVTEVQTSTAQALRPLSVRLDQVKETSEAAQASSSAALRSAAEDGDGFRHELRASINDLREEMDGARGDDRRLLREEIGGVREELGGRLHGWQSESGKLINEARQRLSALWQVCQAAKPPLACVPPCLLHPPPLMPSHWWAWLRARRLSRPPPLVHRLSRARMPRTARSRPATGDARDKGGAGRRAADHPSPDGARRDPARSQPAAGTRRLHSVVGPRRPPWGYACRREGEHANPSLHLSTGAATGWHPGLSGVLAAAAAAVGPATQPPQMPQAR